MDRTTRALSEILDRATHVRLDRMPDPDFDGIITTLSGRRKTDRRDFETTRVTSKLQMNLGRDLDALSLDLETVILQAQAGLGG